MANKCFGLVMLVTIVNVFVSFVTTSFEIVRSMAAITKRCR
jgi:gustatory receptor